jgi:putative ABC transport system permease protein
MGMFHLTIRNATRAPLRGLLTVVAVAVTLVAFVLLRTLSAGWTERVEQTPNDRVVTRHRIGWASPLPVHYTDQVRRMDGVVRASGGRWLGLKLPQDETERFQSWAIDAREFADMHYELAAPPEHKESFVANKRGMLVGAELAQRHGWRLGQVLHFRSRDYAGEWELEISAIVRSTRVGFGQNVLWMHWDYFNDTLPLQERDRIDFLVAQLQEPSRGARLAKEIDIHFDTQNDQTFSQEDKALNTAIVGRFAAMLGAMNLVSLLVLGVVVLILGNTMALSTNERIRELGTLRAMGFLPRHLASFVLGEAAVLGLLGGTLGLLLAYPLVQGPLSRYLQEEMGVDPLQVAAADALGALLLGGVLAVVAAGLPALRAARLQVTEALAYLS